MREIVAIIVAITLSVMLSITAIGVSVYYARQVDTLKKELVEYEKQTSQMSDEEPTENKEFLEDFYLNLYGGKSGERSKKEVIWAFKKLYPNDSPTAIEARIAVAKARQERRRILREEELSEINPEDYNSNWINPEDYNHTMRSNKKKTIANPNYDEIL